MTVENLLTWLVVGLVAGWLAGFVMKGRGYGLVVDVLLGVVGACIGGFLFGLVNVYAHGIVGNTAIAFVGAVVVVTLVRALRGRAATQDL